MSASAARRVVVVLLVVLIWVVAVFASLAALFSAYFGRQNWGDGRPLDPWALTILLASIAMLAPLAAAWVSRTLLRRPPAGTGSA